MATTQARSRRADGTRARLIDAFVALALGQGFENVSMEDIAARAGVGRSTAYSHFRGTVQLLDATLARPCAALAAAVGRQEMPGLVPLLRHFQGQWHRNPTFFREPVWSLFSQRLARAIATTLRLDPDRHRHRYCVPREMLAPILAELQLGIVRRWLEGRPAVGAEVIATALRASAHRLVFGERP